ncbi:MAG: HEAT repeat domain-containing protein [Planctomycetota bacterium]
MPATRCPFCGTQCTDAAVCGDSSFICRNCGKAVEPPMAGHSLPAPLQSSGGSNDLRSDAPPEDSGNRWSAQPSLGDESSPSESVSQTSPLPRSELGRPVSVHPVRSPLVWALILLVFFLVALIGVILLARSMRPWLASRRVAAQQAKVNFWLPRLDNGTDEARREAAQAIVALGPKAVCRTLDHISKDPGGGQRFLFVPGAVRALANVGAEAVPGLREGLGSPEPKVRAVAVEILLQMGAAGRGARDRLLTTLDDPNRWVCYYTIDTLGYLGDSGAPAAKRLAEFLASPDIFARRHAVEALGRIGPEARDAVGALEKAAAEDPDPAIRSSASLALKQIEVVRLAREARREAKGEMKQWLKALQGDNASAAIAAANALGNMGFEGRPAAPGLALMLHHTDRNRRLAAATALEHLGLASADFIPTLEAAAKEEDAAVRAAAAKALEPPGKP